MSKFDTFNEIIWKGITIASVILFMAFYYIHIPPEKTPGNKIEQNSNSSPSYSTK